MTALPDSTIEHQIGEATARSGGGTWKDPSLPTSLVDNDPNTNPPLRSGRVKLGTVAPRAHKVVQTY